MPKKCTKNYKARAHVHAAHVHAAVVELSVDEQEPTDLERNLVVLPFRYFKDSQFDQSHNRIP